MAEQVGLIKLNGPMNGITFYKSRGKYYARTTGKISPERWKYSPEFAATRDHRSEFGSAGHLSGKIRRAVMNGQTIPYNDLHNRLSAVLNSIIKSDPVSDRGKRNFFKGEVTRLKGFNFNVFLPLEHTFFGKMSHAFDTENGKASVELKFTPICDIKAPKGANQVRISTFLVIMPEETNGNPIKIQSSPQYALIDNLPVHFNFEVSAVVPSRSLSLHLLMIEFLKEVNGKTYPIEEKGGKVLTVLDLGV